MADAMRFVVAADSWICSHCASSARESFFQRPLPTDRELEADEIAPDNSQQHFTSFYFKSLRQDESDYEDSVNSSLIDDSNKYHGSAQSALAADTERFNAERERLR